MGGSVGSMRLDEHEDSEPVRIEKRGRFGSERRLKMRCFTQAALGFLDMEAQEKCGWSRDCPVSSTKVRAGTGDDVVVPDRKVTKRRQFSALHSPVAYV